MSGREDYRKQRIRTPAHVYTDLAGTCLDFACLFGAFLENMKAHPVIAVVHVAGGAHAVAGCWLRDAPRAAIVQDPQLVRDALARGDLFFVETTGIAYAERPVAREKRSRGLLTYAKSKDAAHTLLTQPDAKLGFVLNVLSAR